MAASTRTVRQRSGRGRVLGGLLAGPATLTRFHTAGPTGLREVPVPPASG